MGSNPSLEFFLATVSLMEALIERLEQAVIRLEVVSAKLQGCFGNMANGESQCMEAFDHLLRGPLSGYMKNSWIIGGDVAKHAEMVQNALQV
ncbi:adenylyl cyclase-associated protein 1-like [Brachyhypopomus gauderio]|uniref:adenylyl cyclase-associated protein 1-like n=1 Tax=Brachyhypopomus gauderio TaxID=698409 RepID=UPI0040422B9E